jgi:DNA excision repair protein ERCC-5
LEQAQVTAANLTNWAGRAFRRAVAQHAAEAGLTIPPGTTLNIHEQPATPSTPKLATQDTSVLHAFDAGETSVEPLGRISDQMTTNSARSHSPAQQEIHKSPVAWSEAIGEDAVMRTLEEYQEQWAHDRNHNAQEAETITDEMRVEAMNLLQLFGVPYIEAPAEAEAQCVMLEKLGLVDGIVTEDSDVFVFGGKRVYKNIFDDQKYVEVYDAADAEREMNLTRDGLVALAMLLGGDYTEGVKGVGIVNGMEIIDAFDVSQDLKIGLEKFRKWLDGFNPFDSITVAKPVEDELLTKERVFHRKHQSARTRWIAPKFFPDPKVLNAYLHPVVDNSEERFTWAVPDMERLILFCNKHVGWPADETRKMIQPVIEKIEQGRSMHQTRIDSFMRYEDGIQFANVRSKRLREVLENVKKQTSSTKQASSKRQKPSAAEKKD